MTSATSNIAFGDAYSSVQANNINGSVHIGLENTLDRLPRAEDAPFNSYARQHEDVCLPDTRVDLLQEIYSWADGQDERCIFWLSGLAGTGKSTIARTVAENYYANQRLAANFFFSRGGGNVSHAGLFVTSIAVQLADNVPASRHHIRDAVAERSDIARQSLRDQWQRLVLRPLSKLREVGSYVVVVDALDECDNDDNIRTIVQLLAEVRQSLTGVRLRVLLTSRPEVPIRHGFRQMADSKHKDVVLHNLSPSVVDHDIELFLEYWLRKIAKDYYYADDWPGAETIRKLVQGACGLFIWAATARRFIQEGGQFADDRLRIILKDSAVTDNLSKDSSSSEDSYTDDQLEIPPEKRLDSIYLAVLKRPIRRYRKYERKKWYRLIKEILGAIVLLHSPLSAISLARLLLISPEEVYRTLDELHSILDVPQFPDHHVRLHHPSFRDFILNKDRCRDANLWVEERQVHTALADKCIQLLSRLLKQNICGVVHLGTRAAKMEREHLEDCVLPEMQYACLYWANHLTKSGVQLRDNDKVHDFLKRHFLHWLEAIGWMGKVSEGIYAISSLESLASVSDCPALYGFIHDMKRFALYSRVPIEIAPLQVHSSALLFAPANSIVKRQFVDQLTQWIKSPPQVDDEWSACLQTLEGHSDSIDSVVFSHNSTRLASVSDDGQAKIWDVRSGECLKTFEIHNSNHSIAFSHDLTWLASWSYNSTTIKIWDINSGACLNTLEAYTSVHLIAFSHDSMKLASVSFKGAIEIWDASSGVCLSTSKIPECNLYLKAFSHDLMHLAAVSEDNKTIQIWDNTSGECVQTLDSHFDSVMPLAFSQDSAWLASAPDDYTAINIWDVSSGACLHTLEGHEDDVTSVAFSHDSMRLASASYDQTVMIWDTSNGACLQIYEGHSRTVNSIAFSHDSAQLASASRDMTIKIWDTGSSTCLRTHTDNNEDVRSMTFTHDWMQQVLDTTACTCPESDEHGGRKRRSTRPSILIRHDLRWIARGLENGTIKIKDRESGAHLKTLEGHCSSIEKLAVSHDSTRLASMSQDKTVKIWDVSSGACLQTIESYSGCHFSSIAFSHGSMLLALAFDDGTVQIWDISSGTFLRTLYGHNRFVDNVGFSDDSTKLASVSFDRTVTVWDTSSGTRLQTFKSCVLSRVTDIFRLPRSEGTVAPDQTTNCSINISQDNTWVSLNGQEQLWLPVEYRPGHFFISGGYITIAKHSGKTWRCHFV